MTLVDTVTAAALVRALGHPCQPATIRQWASRGYITAKAEQGRQRLYDLDEVQRVAESRLSHST